MIAIRQQSITQSLAPLRIIHSILETWVWSHEHNVCDGFEAQTRPNFPETTQVLPPTDTLHERWPGFGYLTFDICKFQFALRNARG